MANEFQCTATTGWNVYALLRDSAAQIWSTVANAFVTYVAGDYANYDIVMQEQGGSGYYVGSLPAQVPVGIFTVLARRRMGGTPAESDPDIAYGTISNNANPGEPMINLGEDCEFLLAQPLYLGEDTTFTIAPFSGVVSTVGWTYSLYLCDKAGGTTVLSLTGPSGTLSESANIWTGIFTAAQMTPANTPGLEVGVFWMGLWRTNSGSVECLASGPVKIARLPGRP